MALQNNMFSIFVSSVTALSTPQEINITLETDTQSYSFYYIYLAQDKYIVSEGE